MINDNRIEHKVIERHYGILTGYLATLEVPQLVKKSMNVLEHVLIDYVDLTKDDNAN